MILWRIEKAEYAETASQGIGAFTVGGRWTSLHHHAVYTSQNISLAMLEVLVHAPTPPQRKAPRVLFRIDLDEKHLTEISLRAVPRPFIPSSPFEETQPLGDAWLASAKSIGLLVPSAIVNFEFNVVLNPLHPGYRDVAKWSKPVPIQMDERLNTSKAVELFT